MLHSMMIVFLCLGALAQTEIKGYVGFPGAKPNSKTLIIRDAAKNYEINLEAIPQDLKEKLLNAHGSSQPLNVSLPDNSFAVKSPRLGIRPDCGEIPTSYDELAKIAKDPKIKNQIDFLKAIPEGTLQTFTFAFQSESAQGPGVSREFPGVFRMSADGKLVMRYTCDPSRPTYNKVEFLIWGDKDQQYKMVDIDFDKEKSHMAEENPKKCMECHNPGGRDAPADPRAIFQAYDQWKGFYGSEDDTFISSSTKNQKRETSDFMKQVRTDYLKFREKQKDNPCYSSLPWPKEETSEIYPYATSGRGLDYFVRPNLKFTEVQAHLASKRLFRKLKEKPEYKYIKYALAMKAAGCRQYNDKFISQIIPEVKFNSNRNRVYSFRSDPRNGGDHTYGAMYSVGKTLGIQDADWTLNFKPTDPVFTAGIGGAVSDINIGDIAESEILKDISEELPTIKDTFTFYQDTQITFSRKQKKDHFECIDELGSDLVLRDSQKLCDSLAKAQNDVTNQHLPYIKLKNLYQTMQERRKTECVKEPLETSVQDTMTDIVKAAELSLQEGKYDAKKGKTLLNQNCMDCHTKTSGKYGFFDNEEAIKSKLEKHPTFINHVKDKMSAKEDFMPEDAEKPLPEEDQGHILEYLKTFLKK